MTNKWQKNSSHSCLQRVNIFNFAVPCTCTTGVTGACVYPQAVASYMLIVHTELVHFPDMAAAIQHSVSETVCSVFTARHEYLCF
jgi:hypothetical protein